MVHSKEVVWWWTVYENKTQQQIAQRMQKKKERKKKNKMNKRVENMEWNSRENMKKQKFELSWVETFTVNWFH